jgi:hypothetical protein
MSTASAEARAQCAARLRILHSLDRSRRRQRNPGDQDRSELVSERTSLGHLNRNETKIAATITFAHEMAAARAQDAYAVEQDQALRRIAAARTFLIYGD